MAKLFLSYAHEDAAMAERLALALKRSGHQVWWDRVLYGGASFSSEIERQLQDSDVVVVIWSRAGVQSSWVRDEASIGRDAGKLLPVSIDGTPPPIGFRQFHALDIKGWRGGKPELAKFEEAIARAAGAPEQSAPVEPPRRQSPLNLNLLIAAAILALVLLATWLLLRGGTSTTTIAVIPASSTGNGSLAREYAQSITVDLAEYLPAHSPEVSVVDSGDAAFRLSVSLVPKAGLADASLALSTRGSSGILWSRKWSDVHLQTVDLKKQMALVASQAVMCAAQTTSSTPPLRPNLSSLYVRGCAADSMRAGEAKSMFSRITREAPRFAPGWIGLAEAYASLGLGYYYSKEAVPPDLSREALAAIHTATRLNPHSGRAFVAQLPFVAKGAADEIRIYEKAVELDPDEAFVHQGYSQALANVGRMRDSADEAKRAVDLNPLSADVYASYISALVDGGWLEQARQEMAKAERIWPNSPSLVAEDFWFNLRYGDAKRAEMLLLTTQAFTERGLKMARLFLKARTQPTPANIAASTSVFAENQKFPRFANQALLGFGTLNQVERAFQLLRDPQFLQHLEFSYIFRADLRPVRRDPRFMGVMAQLGLVKYWRESGHWPDFCTLEPIAYDCKAEAAKYPN